jgi:predicted GH43/DUF377 family glycosyl hydrolase
MTLTTPPAKWSKRGLVIRPQTNVWWVRSHAMIPVPEDIGDGLWKIYFSGRNDHNQSHIGWALMDMNNPDKVVEYSTEPVLAPGDLGCFDDNGVTPSCVIREGDETRLYYIGWNPGSTVRMHLYGGLAISTDGGATFKRWSRAPILERCPTDPFLNTAPWAVRGDVHWHLYYVSGTEWVHKDLPRYNIKLATSKDGKVWKRDGHVCIDFLDSSENALARPYVVREDGIWKMWFAHKGAEYRIGYAESEDGITWQRHIAGAGLDVTPGSWDSDMVEYAAVIRHKGQRFMFYNGNNYGYDGIGLAVEA